MPRTKINSGYRSSPRTSTGSESDVDVTPSKQPEAKPVSEDTDVEDMDVDVAKTSTQPTTSPRKVETPVVAKKSSVKSPKKRVIAKKTPIKSPKTPLNPKSPGKSPKSAKKSKLETPVLPVKRKPSISPPKSHGKRQKLSSPGKSDTPVSAKKVPKTPMIKTPPKGQTPNVKTPKDNILDSPQSDMKPKTPKDAPKTPMVKTPAKGNTPMIHTPKDELFESPTKTPTTKTPAKTSKTPKVGKTPKSVVKKLGKTPKTSTLYSEIVKKNLGISNRRMKVARVEGGKISKVKTKSKVVVKTPKKAENKKPTSSTGHADSPETIVIGKKKVAATPKSTKKTVKTPKSVKVAAKTPKSVVKKLGGRTPARSVKKTLWSEIVKKNLGKTPNKGKVTKVLAVKKALQKKPVKPVVTKTPKKLNPSLSSTGHANSPAPIVITKKAEKKEVVVTKKGRNRKSDVKTRKIVEDKTNYEGVADMLQSPAPSSKTPTIEVTKATPGRKSSEKRYPKNLSVLQTHQRLNTPGSESNRRQSMGSVTKGRKSLSTPVSIRGRKSLGASPSATPQNKTINR